MIINLPFPPSTNTYWRHAIVNGSPRTLLSAKGRIYRKQVAHILAAEHRGTQAATGPLRVLMELHPPDNRRRDLDNYSKAVWDALEGTVYEDDSQIREAHFYWRPKCEGGRVIVMVEAIDD